jgi:hypothetical protein
MKMTFAQMIILLSDTVICLVGAKVYVHPKAACYRASAMAKSRTGRWTRVKPRLAFNAYKSPMPSMPSVHNKRPQLALEIE